MLTTYLWTNLDVTSVGITSLGVLTAPVPGQVFMCEGGGFIKNDDVDLWSNGGTYSIGFNAPSYNNVVPAQVLSTTPKLGRCVSQPNLRGVPDGTTIFLRVVAPGSATPGPARLDVYIVGVWTFL